MNAQGTPFFNVTHNICLSSVDLHGGECASSTQTIYYINQDSLFKRILILSQTFFDRAQIARPV